MKQSGWKELYCSSLCKSEIRRVNQARIGTTCTRYLLEVVLCHQQIAVDA